MKKKYLIYLLLALIIAFGACNEPVFYIISVEPPITNPLIEGSPTNFTVFEDKLYVATGRKIFCYDGKSWKLIPSQPGGKIMQLAATDSYLYALCLEDSGNRIIKRSVSGEEWKNVTGETEGNRFQSLYAGQNRVFIGTEKNSFYFISEKNDDVVTKLLTPDHTNEGSEYMLCGIAYDSLNYYLCTKGDVIFTMPKDDSETVKSINAPNAAFTGIINLDTTNNSNKIVAISRKGNLYNITSAGLTQIPDISFGRDRPSTGALAVWKDDDGVPKLLLAGRQDSLTYTIDSGYTYGYMEIELDSGKIKTGSNFAEPGKVTPSSVADNERYSTTIGKHPVNHLLQAPDGTLFASTQKNGVWSYRKRNDIPQWNAEE